VCRFWTAACFRAVVGACMLHCRAWCASTNVERYGSLTAATLQRDVLHTSSLSLADMFSPGFGPLCFYTASPARQEVSCVCSAYCTCTSESESDERTYCLLGTRCQPCPGQQQHWSCLAVGSAHEGSTALALVLSRRARLVRLHSARQSASRAGRGRARRTQTARRAAPPPARTSCWSQQWRPARRRCRRRWSTCCSMRRCRWTSRRCGA